MTATGSPLLSDLAPHRLRPVIMPIRSIPDLRYAGFEVLTRGPSGTGLEMPEIFFREAQRQGCVEEMDRRCIRQALVLAASLPAATPVFINAFADTMMSSGFAEWLDGMVSFAGCSPQHIVLEIHERIKPHQVPALFATIVALRRSGFRVALDDVVLLTDDAPLLSLRPEYIKVDRSILLDHPRKRAKEKILDLVDICRDVDADLIIEGVERPEHVDLARKCGVRLGQGFHLGKPAEARCYINVTGAMASA
jgi:EAL domain-containing protein (putative c-di-GMP-specific phosphodiesterase class I)